MLLIYNPLEKYKDFYLDTLIANSINQITKRVNSTGVIYSDDINNIKRTNRTSIKRNMVDSFIVT